MCGLSFEIVKVGILFSQPVKTSLSITYLQIIPQFDLEQHQGTFLPSGKEYPNVSKENRGTHHREAAKCWDLLF